MISKDYLKQIAESKGVCPLTNEVKDNALLFPIGFEYIFKDLDRLEKLEKIFSDSHICEIKERFNEIECSADKCDNCPLGIGDGICLKKTFERKWELQKENQELIKKADCCLWHDCNKISQENQELKDTNMEYAKLIDDFQTKNMRLEKAIKKAIELLSIDGKGTKKQVLNLLKEVLEE